ncbi:MAG: HAD hydrolase-like protein [Clostridia bacterium]|nr:HAD hydrolase-like protein [Clostridia bacterium]
MIEYVLFDLDGTLTDPGEGITNSVAYALAKFGIKAERQELYKFIGPPLITSFMEYYDLSKEDGIRAVAYYREYYTPKGIFENKLYDGIPEMLGSLKKSGKKIILATSKPENYAAQILEHFGIMKYFDACCGNTMDDARHLKADVIAYVRERFPDITAENTVMVGDRMHDVEGAAVFGIPTVGVTFGYGGREELEGAGAKCTVDSAAELENIIQNWK